MTSRIFYGWWIVGACLLTSLTGNALGLFGAGIYLRAITASTGWATSVVSGAITLFYVMSAILLIPVGSGIHRFGPRPFVTGGGLAIAAGVAGMGHVNEPWHAYVLFSLMGVGWACLSTTAVATTLAPWFEKYQGRAVTIASLGASLGGMLGPPLLLLGVDRIGFTWTTSFAAVIALVVLTPLALFVLRRRPEDIGLSPDGMPQTPGNRITHQPRWTRANAMRTRAFRTTVIAFGIAMSMQIGLVTHQAALLTQFLSTEAVAATLSATAISALIGRVGLARFADRIDARVASSIVFLVAAAAYCALAVSASPVSLIGASVLFGLTVGNVTTLSPIIVRREFGAAAFGPIFGVASCIIQLAAAMGPSFYGLVHDWSGDYRDSLLVAAVVDAIAAMVIKAGRQELTALASNPRSTPAANAGEMRDLGAGPAAWLRLAFGLDDTRAGEP